MPEVDAWADVLDPKIRAVWPLLASAVKNIRGSLVGGTALSIHLRHRRSYDLDFMTYGSFSGEHLHRKLASMADTTVLRRASQDQLNAYINGVAVDVFLAPYRGIRPGYVKQLQEPAVVDGMRVASLPDLLATKLDIIMYRPKLRDYIDIAAIDMSGRLRIEDGLRLHIERYGTGMQSQVVDHIVDLLENPGRLTADRVFDHRADDTLSYLRERVPSLWAHIARMRVDLADPSTAPTDRASARGDRTVDPDR